MSLGSEFPDARTPLVQRLKQVALNKPFIGPAKEPRPAVDNVCVEDRHSTYSALKTSYLQRDLGEVMSSEILTGPGLYLWSVDACSDSAYL
jgi:hypothetical protein